MEGKIKHLFRIIEHTAALTARIHGVFDKDEIFRIVADELKKAEGYEMVVMLLSDDRQEFVMQVVTLSEFQIQAIEKLIGTKVIGYRRPYELLKVTHRVVENQETYTFPTNQFIGQLVDGAVGKMVSLITGHSQKTSAVSPIVIGNKVVGVLGIDTPQENEFQDFFELIVKNLAKHISVALELAEETTSRRNAEVELKQSEKGFRSLVENSPDAIVSIDSSGNVTSWNPGAERLFGYSNTEIVGKPYVGLVPDDCREERELFLNKARKDGFVLSFQTVRVTKNGLRKDVEMTLSCTLDTNGEESISAFIRDITDRKKAELGLLIRDRAFESLDQGIVITDPTLPDNPIIFANRTFETLSGYSAAEVVGKNCRFLQGPETDKKMIRAINSAIAGGKDLHCEILNYKKDGSAFWNELTLTAIKDDQGNLVNYIGRQLDITAKKVAHKRLQDSEFLLKQTHRIAGIGSYKLDFKTGMWTSSELLDLIFGIDRDYERSVEGWLSLVHPDQRDELKDYLEQEIIEKQARFNKEYQIIRQSDRKKLWVHGIGELEFDVEGKLSGMKGVIRDITESKLASDRLRELSKAMEQSPASVVITDLKGNIKYVNPKFEEVTGFSAKKVIGKNPRLLKSGHTSSEEYENLWKTITAGKTWTGEFHNRKRDGTLYWEKASIGPILNDKGEITEYLAVKEDITDMKQTQEMLKDTLLNMEDLVLKRTDELRAAKSSLEKTNEEFMSSLYYAQRIQQASLPSEIEFKQAFENHFVLFRPKDIVSGDFYWLYRKDHEVVLAMVDCTGHGVPGALMSMAGNEQMGHIVVRRKVLRPDVILEEMDQAIAHLLQRKKANLAMHDGMDMSVVYIDYEKMIFEFAGAQSHGLFIKKDRVIPLVPDRIGIGGLTLGKFKDFSRQRFEFEKGDRFYLFSDGYYDQFGGPLGKKMLRKNLCQLLTESPYSDLKTQHQMLEDYFDEWIGGGVQIDDVTMVGIEL